VPQSANYHDRRRGACKNETWWVRSEAEPPWNQWSVKTRVPRELEALVRGRASAQGLSFSDVTANAIAVSFDREPVIEPRHDQLDDDQEHLLAS